MAKWKQTAPKSIILITLDTLRADHLGSYGYPLPTSPFLDSLASEGVLFQYAFSPIPLTAPAHASILTGKYPRFHSIGFSNGDRPLSKEQEITLPHILRQLGYRTAALVSIGPLLRQTGLDAGFDFYDDLPQRELNRPWEPRRSADLTTQTALRWLGENRDSPFFLWIHYAEPHGPYTPPPPYNRLFVDNNFYGTPRMLEIVPSWHPGGFPAYQALKPEHDSDGNLARYETDLRYYLSQYDGYIRYVDDQLEILIERLKRWDIYESALLIVTADHGEALGENDFFFTHGHTVSLDQLRVPLLIKCPEGGNVNAQRVSGPVTTVDIMPTVLGLLGQEVHYLGLQGINLLPSLDEDGTLLARRYIFSEIPTQLSVIHGHFQLLYEKEREDIPYPRVPAVASTKLFDYIADPVCKHDLSLKFPEAAEALTSVAKSYLRLPVPSYTKQQLSPRDRDEIYARLEQLGYMPQDTQTSKRMLQFTGERFLPWIPDYRLCYEHLHRYAFASWFVKGKNVLDLACGEGYGANVLAKEAEYVIGIEIDRDTVEHARAKYIRHNLEFIQGSMLAIPIRGGKLFDVITCFEAIEHVIEHEELLSEVKRLLKDDGIFIVSTPNKAVLTDTLRLTSQFHVRELYLDEFQDLLRHYFKYLQICGQCVYAGSNIWGLSSRDQAGYMETVIKRGEPGFEFAGGDSKQPWYIIAIAADTPLDLPRYHVDSWLVDASNTLLDHYEVHITQLNTILQEKEAQLQGVRQGILMQLLARYQRIVERLLPGQTRRRYYYELVLAGIRVLLNEGWRSFRQRVQHRLKRIPRPSENGHYRAAIAHNALAPSEWQAKEADSPTEEKTQ